MIGFAGSFTGKSTTFSGFSGFGKSLKGLD